MVLVFTAGVGGWWQDDSTDDLNAVAMNQSDDPEREPAQGLDYVGSAQCLECHEEEADKWHGSDHQRAMSHATSETVLADFDDATFEYNGVTSRMYRDGERYMVETDGPDGQLHAYEVKYTFGYRPLQQYLLEMPGGRLQAWTIAWDTQKGEWFFLYPDEESIDKDDPLHWTRMSFTWNLMCASCHSTNVQKNYDLETNTYDTTYTDVSVGCEACHGPGSKHVQLADAYEESEGVAGWGMPSEQAERKGLTVVYRHGEQSNRNEIDTCAPCHSRRMQITHDYVPGDRFFDHFSLEMLEPDLYYSDGQIQDEVFVYGSFLQARMHRQHVHCTDCHDAHTTRIKLVGNALCTQCHEATQYDAVSHHYHEAGTDASLCVECHMPNRTYMVVDPRRDHSIRVPRPDFTVQYDIPNACNKCHTALNETAQWAADAIVEWYGPQRADEPHFAHAIEAAMNDTPEGLALIKQIVELDRDTLGPQGRATAASWLGMYSSQPEAVEVVREALAYPHPQVRLGALRALEYFPLEALLDLGAGPLQDRYRNVRAEAARILSQIPVSLYPEGLAAALAGPLQEYEAAQKVNADHPGAELNLGVLYTWQGKYAEAEQAYVRALKLERAFLPARFNLAMLYYNQGNFEKSEQQYRAIIEIVPDDVDALFSLGLLLYEKDGSDEVSPEMLELLDHAAEIAPKRGDVQYSRGLLHQLAGNLEQSEQALWKASNADRQSAEPLHALVLLYLDQKNWDRAQMCIDLIREIEERYPERAVGRADVLQRVLNEAKQ